MMHDGKAIVQRRPRRGFLSRRIARRLAVAAFACALILGIAAIAIGSFWLRGAFIEGLKNDTITVVRSAIDPSGYPTLDELVRTGEHLVRTSDIVGGTFVTGVGVERASFGDPPQLTWARARLEGVRWVLDRQHQSFETFVSPEKIGLGHGLLVKVRADGRRQVFLERLSLLAGLGLLAAAAMAGCVGLAARQLVGRRLGAIEEAVMAGLEAPGSAVRKQSRVAGADELAKLSLRVDRLLTVLSKLINTDVAAARAIVERCPFAVITIAPDGQIVSANWSALRLFEVPTLEEIPGRDGGILCLLQGEPMTATALLAREEVHGAGEIVLSNLTVPVRIGADAMHGPDGVLLGCFVMFIDVRDMVADMRRQVALREEARIRQRRAESELARLRGQLEACLVILEHEKGQPPPQFPDTVEPSRLVEEWLEKAVKRGEMAADGVIYKALPQLRVDPAAARRLFCFLLDAVRLRSGLRRPFILVTAAEEGGAERLTVRAIDAANNALCEPIAADTEATLLVGAIGLLAASQGGRMLAEKIDETGNGITVLLPRVSALVSPRSTAEATASAA